MVWALWCLIIIQKMGGRPVARKQKKARLYFLVVVHTRPPAVARVYRLGCELDNARQLVLCIPQDRAQSISSCFAVKLLTKSSLQTRPWIVHSINLLFSRLTKCIQVVLHVYFSCSNSDFWRTFGIHRLTGRTFQHLLAKLLVEQVNLPHAFSLSPAGVVNSPGRVVWFVEIDKSLLYKA